VGTQAVLLAAPNGGGSSLVTLFPLLALVVFFFFITRAQRSRRRAVAQTQAALVAGQEVVTTTGIYGTVAELGPDFVLLEVAPGVRMKFARGAIATVLNAEEPVTEIPPEDRS